MRRSRAAWGSITYAQWASRSDQELAHELGVTVGVVRERRRRFGHPSAPDRRTRAGRAAVGTPRRGRPPVLDWTAIDTEVWATRTNTALAVELGLSAVTVAKWRARLGAPASPAAGKGRR